MRIAIAFAVTVVLLVIGATPVFADHHRHHRHCHVVVVMPQPDHFTPAIAELVCKPA